MGAEAGGHVGGAHLGELHQHGGRALGVGAGVDQHGRRAPQPRERCGDAGPHHAGQPAHAQQRRSHGGTRVAGRHHGGGLPVAHQLGGPHQGGVLLAAHTPGRVLVHADDLGAGQQLQALGVADQLGRAHEHNADPVLLGRPAGTFDDFARGQVAAHGVDGNGDHGNVSAPHANPTRNVYSWTTSITSRPLYCPQCGQTRCGNLGS